jgi:predicted DNA-binding transcriptional regulator AlpA
VLTTEREEDTMTTPKHRPPARGGAAAEVVPWPDPPALSQRPAPVLLSRDDLREFYGIRYSRWHIHRLTALGRFPAPVALAPERYARKCWRRDDIEKWIAALR